MQIRTDCGVMKRGMLLTIVQRNTPPNATSSPKITALSSFSKEILEEVKFKWSITMK